MAYSIVLDTETAPMFGRKTAKPEPWNSLVYDLGLVVVNNKTGQLVCSRSFAIQETFGEPRTMRSAFYADKLPAYYVGMYYGPQRGADASRDEWRVVPFREAMAEVTHLVEAYDVRKVWAYNVRFDQAALDNTARCLSNGFIRFFLPEGVEWCDIWDYADCLTGSRAYVNYCAEQNLFTPNGNPKTNAEAVYGYVMHNPEHVERHTALSDAQEEAVILSAARKCHKSKSTSRGQGWRKAAAAYKAYLAAQE